MRLKAQMIIFIFVAHAAAIRIDNDGQIRHFHWRKHASVLPQLASKPLIVFFEAEIVNLSEKMLDQLTALKELRVQYGEVNNVFAQPSLERLFIADSKTEQVFIVRDMDYQIIEFTVVKCPLTVVPQNLDRLYRLKVLSLSFTLIESIEMSLFNNFHDLEKLTLGNNRITVLTTSSSIYLPKLTWLTLNTNQIPELDVCRWKMPALSILLLNQNKLAYVVNVLQQFPNLKRIALEDNAFNCDWQDEMLRNFRKTKVSHYNDRVSFQCNASHYLTPPSECPAENSLQLVDNITQDLRKLPAVEVNRNQILHEVQRVAYQLQKESVDDLIVKLEHQWLKMENGSQEVSLRLQHQQDEIELLNGVIRDQEASMVKLNQTIVNLEIALKKGGESCEVENSKQVDRAEKQSQLWEQQQHRIDDLIEAFYRFVVEDDVQKRQPDC